MKRFPLVIWFLTVGLCLASAQEVKVLQKTLDNGLTILVKENHIAPVVSLRIYVRVGSINEGRYLGAGISHLIEHLVHGGTTKKRTEKESEKLIASIGNSTNAYTTSDHTNYYINTTKEYFDTALDLLSDWVMNATIPQEAFDREFKVVQREIEKGDGEPYRVLQKLSVQTLFKVHPCRIPTIGYLDVFRTLTRDDVLKFYRRMYIPNNMIAVAVGDFDGAQVMAKMTKAFADFKPRRLSPNAMPVEPEQLAKREAEEEMNVQVAYLTMGWRTVMLSHPDLYPLDVMSYILSNGNSSRLVKRIKDEKQLVYSITTYSYTPGTYDGGRFVVMCQLDPAKLEAAQKEIVTEIYRLQKELVTDEELAKTIKQKKAEEVFGKQTAQAEASDIGGNMLSAYDPEFTKTYIAGIEKVTKEQIRDVARKYFSDDKLCVAVVRPPRPKKTEAASAAAAKETAIRKEVLPNGLRVLLKRNPSIPIVAMQAYALGGVRLETEQNNGICRLMSALLVKGTKTRTADNIAETFDSMGGSIGASSGNNSFFCNVSVLKEDFATGLDVMADVLTNPTFPDDEIEKMRQLMIAGIKRRRDSWQSAAATFFRKKFFDPKSPYHLLPGGEIESVSKLTRADLVAYHKEYCAPNNMVLAIFGDIDPDAALAEVKAKFAAFAKNDALRVPEEPARPPLKENEVFTDQSPVPPAVIYIGFPGMTLDNVEDRYPMEVLDAVISGINYPGGWLHDELRGKGLVYVVHAYNWLGVEPGYFGAYAACEPAKVDEVKKVMLDVFDRIKKKDVADDEFERAKRICITEEQLSKQKNSDQASTAALNELYGLGYDFESKHTERILAVTKADVKRVAEKYFTHYVMTVSIPGTAEEKKAQ
ncbi:MAG: insulinase family protein [Planctomycetes bacterium]|nr:insulinase family protein [Planctomycetota bacterium]